MVLQLFWKGKGRDQVAFVEHHQIGDLPGLDLLEQFPVKSIQSADGIHHQESDIRAPEHQTGFFDPGLTQIAVVIHPRGICQQDGTQGQDLHGFGDRIGGGPFEIRDDGQVLAGDGVDQG